MTFGRALFNLRRAARISQRDLAAAVGVNHTYLSKIEAGKQPPPSEETVCALARELEADADELLALAGKVPADVVRLWCEDAEIRRMLRRAIAETERSS